MLRGQTKARAHGGRRCDPSCIAVRQASLDRLPYVNLVHEIIPGGTLGQLVDETVGFGFEIVRGVHDSSEDRQTGHLNIAIPMHGRVEKFYHASPPPLVSPAWIPLGHSQSDEEGCCIALAGVWGTQVGMADGRVAPLGGMDGP